MRAATTSTDLSIRQIQSKIAGRASRGIVGEITKRARASQHRPCDNILHVSSGYPCMRHAASPGNRKRFENGCPTFSGSWKISRELDANGSSRSEQTPQRGRKHRMIWMSMPYSSLIEIPDSTFRQSKAMLPRAFLTMLLPTSYRKL